MKRLTALLLVFALLLSGCGASAPTQEESSAAVPEASSSPETEELVQEQSLMMEYTNLNSEESRQQVDTILESAGVSEQRRRVFFDHVEQFNSAVDASFLLGEFQTADILNPAYDPYDYQDEWMAQHPDFSGYNCRITAFSLFGDYLTAAEDGEIRDLDLFMDLEALDADPSALMGDEPDTFQRLFSNIPTDNTTDASIHAANVVADWEKRGIDLHDSDTLSLITVWFHNQWSEEDNELFIGHVGVLADIPDGLYFVEKVAFQEPYQVVKVESREALCDYLMAKYDVSWGQNTAAPFVMENDTLLSEN